MYIYIQVYKKNCVSAYLPINQIFSFYVCMIEMHMQNYETKFIKVN